MQGWIGVDLDGTLAVYTKWEGPTKIGAPIPPMVDRVKRWLAEGRDVRIFTARVSYPTIDEAKMSDEQVEAAVSRKHDADLARVSIELWCKDHIGQVLPVTNIKDYDMLELWDDRAVQVIPNTGNPMGYSTRGLA